MPGGSVPGRAARRDSLEVYASKKLLEVAEKLAAKGNLTEASAAYQVVLGRSPASAELLRLLGWENHPLDQGANQPSGSDSCSDLAPIPAELVDRMPTFAEAQWWVGICEIVQGQPSQGMLSIREIGRRMKASHVAIGSNLKRLQTKVGGPLLRENVWAITELGQDLYRWARQCQAAYNSGHTLLRRVP